MTEASGTDPLAREVAARRTAPSPRSNNEPRPAPQTVCHECHAERLGHHCLVCGVLTCGQCASEAEAVFISCGAHLERLALRAYQRGEFQHEITRNRLSRARGIVTRIRALAWLSEHVVPERQLLLTRLADIHLDAGEALGWLEAGGGDKPRRARRALRQHVEFVRGFAAGSWQAEKPLLWAIAILVAVLVAGFFFVAGGDWHGRLRGGSELGEATISVASLEAAGGLNDVVLARSPGGLHRLDRVPDLDDAAGGERSDRGEWHAARLERRSDGQDERAGGI